VGEFLSHARRGWRWHRRLAEGRIDRLKGVALDVQDLIEGFGEGLPQVHAIGARERVGGALPGPIRRGAGPIPGDYADARMGL
jgi:hypothetical protein